MTYSHQVRYAKVFTAGALKGLRVEGETLSFTDVKSAHAFIRRALAKPQRKSCAGSDYRIADPYLFVL